MKRKKNNTKRKEEILKLRELGKTYNEIQDILGCSKSVISYHCGEDKTEKKRVKERNKTAKHKLSRKVSAFKCRIARGVFRGKLKTFKRRNKNRTHTIVNNLSKNFSTQDVLNKFGENPTCYLTGTPIDLNKPETYHFDHIVPASKGGTNDLSNLEICLKEANNAKNDLSLDELYDLCEAILNHRNKKKLD